MGDPAIEHIINSEHTSFESYAGINTSCMTQGYTTAPIVGTIRPDPSIHKPSSEIIEEIMGKFNNITVFNYWNLQIKITGAHEGYKEYIAAERYLDTQRKSIYTIAVPLFRLIEEGYERYIEDRLRSLDQKYRPDPVTFEYIPVVKPAVQESYPTAA